MSNRNINYFTNDGVEYCFTFIGDIPYIGSNSKTQPAISKDQQGKLIIPSYFQYDDKTYPITHFSQYSFYLVEVKDIIFPKTTVKLSGAVCEKMPNLEFVDLSRTKIEKIYGYCFSQCLKLKTILLPISLQVIGNNSFLNVATLTKLLIYEALTEIHSEYSSEHPLQEIYYCGKSDNGLSLPSSVTRVFVPNNYIGETFSSIQVVRTITNCDLKFTCNPQIHFITYKLCCFIFVIFLK